MMSDGLWVKGGKQHKAVRDYRARMGAGLATIFLLASCSTVVPPAGPQQPKPPTAPLPLTARDAGVFRAQSFDDLGISAPSANAALKAFITSCPALLSRTDTSGLTVQSDWNASCAAARSFTGSDARTFFRDQMTPVRIGDGKAFATGYYIPEIKGSRTRQPGYETPIYKLPPDLVPKDTAAARAEGIDLTPFGSSATGTKLRGRYVNGQYRPYYTRGEIVNGALANKGLELAWAADPVELFFLHVQGSGNLRLPDGSVMRIGYNGGNGQPYVGIGKLLKDRGALGPGQTSMQGIMDYLRADPARGAAVMDENPSYIFFRELAGGAVGAINTEVIGRVTVAADPKFIPLGAPVWLDLDRNEADGLWVAQDTGGAIKGANRVDTFWGAGEDARRIAGGMSGRGSGLILLPKPVAARRIAGR